MPLPRGVQRRHGTIMLYKVSPRLDDSAPSTSRATEALAPPGAARQLARLGYGSGQNRRWNQLRDPVSWPYLVDVGEGGHEHHDLSPISRVDHAAVGEHTFGRHG